MEASGPELHAALGALREAIVDGADCGWAVTVLTLVDLAAGDPEGIAEAFILMDDNEQPRALCLLWPLAQHLFRVLGLTPYGCTLPEHDAVYGHKDEDEDEETGDA